MRTCSKCKRSKCDSEFYKHNRNRKGEKTYSSWCKECFNTYCHERWKTTKLKAIALFGNKCQKCGYDKNLGVLEFHHLDPSKKDYNWNRLTKKPWDEIVKELQKCIMVCRNCHAELHHPDLFINDMRVSHQFLLDRERVVFARPTGKCALNGCNNDVYGTKYCSSECAHMSYRKVKRPSKEQLRKDITNCTWIAVGSKYGVSDNAVRKWARNYGLIS